MRSLKLSDDRQRDSPVAFEPVTPIRESGFALEDGGQIMSVKVIKNTLRCDLRSLQRLSEEHQKEIEDLLIEGDPEIDFDYSGKISANTKTIYLNADETISYNLRFKELSYDPAGDLTQSEDYQRPLSNINSDDPLVWTGKYIPIAKAVRMFVFTKIYQLRHMNGLTFDFLYHIAKQLEQKNAFMLVGAGPSGKEPLRFTRGGPPYRGFLHGKTKGDAYRVTLHLSNMELKDIT